jgi:DNA-binding PadR family transcriptional regulator
MSKPRPRFFVLNDPHPLRINKELACEIGYNESVVLLQLEYLISISTTEEIAGNLWTYQSLTDLQAKYFPWWSTATIARILESLEGKELIKVGNYNRMKRDRTQWFALNPDGISRLQSVRLDGDIFQNEKWERGGKITRSQPESQPEQPPISQNEKCISQNEKSISQNETCISHFETTLPEIPTETPPEIPAETSAEAEAPARARVPQDPAAADLSDVWQALRESGIGKNPRTEALARLPHITPEYIRAHFRNLSRRAEGANPGLLISILEAGDPAPALKPNGHLADCYCDECLYGDLEADEPEPAGAPPAIGASPAANPSPPVDWAGRGPAERWWAAAVDELQLEQPGTKVWLSRTHLRRFDLDAGRFIVSAGDEKNRALLQDRLGRILSRKLVGICARDVEVEFVV